MAENNTWSEYVIEREGSPAWFKAPNARMLVTGLIGSGSDDSQARLGAAAGTAVFRGPDCPDDALPYIAEERMLVRYPGECTSDFKERLAEAWLTWSEAGSPWNLVDQLDAAGFPNCMVQRDFNAYEGNDDLDLRAFPSSADYWSGFVLVVPNETTGTLSTPHFYGDSGLVYGGSPLIYYGTPSSRIGNEEIILLRSIIKKWKPVDFICHAIVLLPTGSVTTAYLANPRVFLNDSEALWGSPGVEMIGAS